MKRIPALIALFSAITATIATVTAQPFRASEHRDPVRGELIAYPTHEEALAAGTGASKYLTPIDQWGGNGIPFTSDFTVPFSWANRQIMLHVASAATDYEVLINGQSAGYNANPSSPADFNITKFAEQGRNRIEIRLTLPSTVAQLESRSENPVPTLGRTYILSQPTLRVRDILVKTWDVEGEMKAEIAVVVHSNALNSRTSRIHYDLRTPSGDTAVSGYEDMTLDMRREDTMRIVTTIPKLLQWSSELPTQYTLMLRTQHEGRYLEYVPVRLGFRIVTNDGGRLHINGNPVELRVAELTSDITETNIASLKEQGYNTIKPGVGHVPDSLYALCDMMGMYVVAQAPIDTHTSGMEIGKGGNPTNDPAWLGAYLERTFDSYHAAKRHPSVVAFSLAEKSANGYNLYESYLNMKRMGDARPFIYRYAAGEWNTDTLNAEYISGTLVR